MMIKIISGNVSVPQDIWVSCVKFQFAITTRVNMVERVSHFQEAVIYAYAHWENMDTTVSIVSTLSYI